MYFPVRGPSQVLRIMIVNVLEKHMSRLVMPTELSRDTLAAIVSRIQGRLYLDMGKDGREFWNPEKDWSGCDVCYEIQDLLHEHGLVPGEEQPCEETVSDPQSDTVLDLVEWAKSNGLGSEDLDDLVHDCTGAMASDINNQGLARQIEFVVDQLGQSGAAARLAQFVDSAYSPQETQ